MSALDELLAAWRATPAAEIAAAIESVPLELGEIVVDGGTQAYARLSAMESSRDPRIASQLVAWIAEPPWHATANQPFFRLVFARLEEIADPRSIDTLGAAKRNMEKLVKGTSMRTWLGARIEKTRAALLAAYPDGVPRLADKARLAQLVKELGADRFAGIAKQTARAVTREQLLAEIRANPHDDAPRIVYADMLVDKGDPRGTFIHMQLARSGREPTVAERKAELALLGKHKRAWLGEIAGAIGGMSAWSFSVGPERCPRQTRFERGFLAGCFLRGTPKTLAPAIGSHELATVEELTLRDEGLPILRDTALPALRYLAIPIELLDVARERFAAQLEAVSVHAYPSPATEQAIARCAEMPALRELELSPQGNEVGAVLLRAAAKLPQLTRLIVRYYATVTFERAGKKTWRVAERDGRSPANATQIIAAVGAA